MQRIAIYSRKSKFTGKGDSIENQIEMCKDYISIKYKKDIDFIIYEDEGFSGGTTDRPQFKKLINDIKLNKLNILVCYRLDRISRNVADFSSTLEILQEHHVDFISISEQFDTSTPMGRAMIYIASVFAQLERETIAERVKDNMIETAKNGKWTGGKIPLGFISQKKKYIDESGLQREIPILKINENEKKFVLLLYTKYLELGSLHKLEVYVTQNQLKSRNDILLEKSSLKIILQNPIYVKANIEVIEYLKLNDWRVYGEADNVHSLLTYNKTEQTIKNGKHVKVKKSKEERFAAVSSIQGFIDPELWLKVQKQFNKNKDTFPRLGKTHNALLTGKLKCGLCNEYMLVQHGKVSKTTGEKLFYYMCSLKRKSHKKFCDNPNAQASKIENLVLLSLKKLAESKEDFLKSLKEKTNFQLKSNSSDIKIELNKLISDKKNQLDNVVNALSNAEDAQDVLLAKIKSLKKEYVQLQERLTNIEIERQEIKTAKINLDIIENTLNDCKIIDSLSRIEQRKIIDTLIDCIYWFGDGHREGKIFVKFIGTDDDSCSVEFESDGSTTSRLQFSSHSTCKAYDYFLSA